MCSSDLQFPGQRGGRAVEGVACLGVHEYVGFVDLEHMLQVFDKRQVGNEFMGGGAAQQPHQLA